MKSEKEILRLCKKEINKAQKICRKSSSSDMIENEINKLNDYTKTLNIENLRDNISRDMLQSEYDRCAKLKNKAEKILVRMKGIQFNITSEVQNLRQISKNMEFYIKEIEQFKETEDLSTMSLILRQNILSIQEWEKQNNKLLEQLNISINTGINLFKNYISQIIKMQKERLQ